MFASPSGFRRVAIADLYTNDGVNRIKLAKNEMITSIYLPESSAGYLGAYKKLRPRFHRLPASWSCSCAEEKRHIIEDAKVAITGVNPAPHLVPDAVHALIGREVNEHAATVVGELASRVAKPLTTSLLTPEYRREMIRVYH